MDSCYNTRLKEKRLIGTQIQYYSYIILTYTGQPRLDSW